MRQKNAMQDLKKWGNETKREEIKRKAKGERMVIKVMKKGILAV